MTSFFSEGNSVRRYLVLILIAMQLGASILLIVVPLYMAQGLHEEGIQLFGWWDQLQQEEDKYNRFVSQGRSESETLEARVEFLEEHIDELTKNSFWHWRTSVGFVWYSVLVGFVTGAVVTALSLRVFGGVLRRL